MMIVLVTISIFFSFSIAPVTCWLFFAPDWSLPFSNHYFGEWLGGVGSARPGWVILFTPLLVVALTLGFNVWIKPFLSVYRQDNRVAVVLMDLARYVAIAAMAIGIAIVLAALMSAAGLDLRGGIAGPYVQRNSLVLGIFMGFAIIPIIYTVSEDALTSVPSMLRSAALGAGATPWQAAVRVVLPVATSGIFSACMIGLGRAAGETMVVLMIAGGTPTLDWNVFAGLRALSANIATEMPEAPVGSTHYRLLFLSALVLFVITFIVNTTAEMIRIRFRKRAYQL
jgi:phosphate transport system permease protein